MIMCSVSHINEDKRRMEGQIMLFDILRDVDGCPVGIAYDLAVLCCWHVLTRFRQTCCLLSEVSFSDWICLKSPIT